MSFSVLGGIMEIILTAVLVGSIAAACWLVATAFRGGAPSGESSARADINAAAASHGTEQMNNIRSNAITKHIVP